MVGGVWLLLLRLGASCILVGVVCLGCLVALLLFVSSSDLVCCWVLVHFLGPLAAVVFALVWCTM